MTCPTCKGVGELYGPNREWLEAEVCPTCNGSGEVEDSDMVKRAQKAGHQGTHPSREEGKL